ncbi:MAG: hypothetical protein M3133_10200 [Actinomycetota bacterium]|nr:hypothetical protein [Actinomycetota bacterium]
MSGWLPALVGAGFYVAFIDRTLFGVDGQRFSSLFDDAMVSMRYARHLATGQGLVWNPGEAPVEGYTNLLWTLWMAFLHWVGIPERLVSLVVMVSGALLLVGTVATVGAVARRLSPADGRVAAAATWFVAFSYPLAFWSLRGMEVGLLALLVTAAVLVVLRWQESGSGSDLLLLACLLLLGMLTRTDAVVPATVLAMAGVAAAPRRRRLRVAAVLAGTLVVTLVAHTGFRVIYYGDALPNTYYLKMEGVALTTRLARGGLAAADTFVQLALPMVLAVGGLLARRRRPGADLLPDHPAGTGALGELTLAGIVLGQFAYSAYVGGDAWEWMRYPNRYVAVSLPALAVLAGFGIRRLLTPGQRSWRWWPVAGGVAALAWIDPARRFAAAGFALRASETDWISELQPSVAIGASMIVVVAASAAGRRAVAGRPRGSHRALVFGVVAVAIWSSSGFAAIDWVRTGGYHVSDDVRMARLGLAVKAATDPEASVAVTWAGALPYFSQRPAVDLLGKSDRRIATMAAVADGFRPGHAKVDHGYSVGRLRPDLVAQVWGGSTGLRDRLRSWGYVEVDGMWVRAGSAHVDVGRLARELAAVRRAGR